MQHIEIAKLRLCFDKLSMTEKAQRDTEGSALQR